MFIQLHSERFQFKFFYDPSFFFVTRCRSPRLVRVRVRVRVRAQALQVLFFFFFFQLALDRVRLLVPDTG